MEGKTLQNNHIRSLQPSHMSEELNRDFLFTTFTETLQNLVGQHVINLDPFFRVTLGSNKIGKICLIRVAPKHFTALHQCFYSQYCSLYISKEKVFDYHELRLLVIISFILVCDLNL